MLYSQNIQGTRITVIIVTPAIPIKSSGSPALAIFRVVINSLENTIAFGGVATGIMNPMLIATVTGTINNKGSIERVVAKDADIGNNNAAVAVLLITSPVKTVTISIINIIIIKGIPSRKDRFFAIYSSNPVSVNPFASANPPPISNKMPHGMVTAFSNLIILY